MKKTRLWIFSVSMLFMGVGLVIFEKLKPGMSNPDSALHFTAPLTGPPEGALKDPSQKGAQILPTNSSQKMAQKKSQQEMWEAFKEKYGSDLKPQFTPNGQLIAIQGAIGTGTQASSDFHPQDPQQAIQRAREILHAAEDLIGVTSEWPLESPAARGSQVSAQVFFNEAHQGVLVSPAGTIKIDLGPHGELIGLYSNYAQNVSLVNQVRLSSEEAQLKAISSFQHDSFSSVDADGGGQIIWVNGREGKYAYQFSVNGYQTIIDAQTGEILFRKNRRIQN